MVVIIRDESGGGEGGPAARPVDNGEADPDPASLRTPSPTPAPSITPPPPDYEEVVKQKLGVSATDSSSDPPSYDAAVTHM